jgi:peptide/nickel transport system permease protein
MPRPATPPPSLGRDLLRALLSAGLVLAAVVFTTELSPPQLTLLGADGEPYPNPCTLDRAASPLARLAQLLRAALTGELRSWTGTCEPVYATLRASLGPTLRLTLAAVVIAWPLSVLGALAQGLRPGTAVDRAVTANAVLLHAVPSVLTALLLQSISAPLGLPFSGAGPLVPDGRPLWPWAVMPTACLALLLSSGWVRPLRAAAVRAASAPAVRAARARGLGELTVIRRFVLPELLRPAFVLLGIALPRLVGGALVVERVFGWRGMGSALADAATRSDLPVLAAGAAVLAFAVSAARAATERLAAAQEAPG